VNPSAVRRALPFVALFLGVVLLGAVAANGRSEGEPLDPRSTDPLGARGLVLLLEENGADVRVAGGRPAEGAVALLLQDRLNEAETADLEDWVGDGGTLVVADPLSSFSPAIDDDPSGLFEVAPEDADLLDPDCDLEAVSNIDRIAAAGAAPYRVPPDAVGCFPVGSGSGPYLVARPEGEGTVVALGGAGPFVNRELDEEDNAVLAVNLLAPRGEGSVVVVVEPSVAGGGDRSLSDLVSRRVKDGLWQLLVAFAVFALWRARRLGRPVLEPQPVQIAGSELVVAVGNLLRQGRRREAAAAMLQSELRRSLSERLGVPADAPAADVAAAVAARTGAAAADVEAALTPIPPNDDAALVELARRVESLRNEVAHAR
jgi:hypothetical protein